MNEKKSTHTEVRALVVSASLSLSYRDLSPHQMRGFRVETVSPISLLCRKIKHGAVRFIGSPYSCAFNKYARIESKNFLAHRYA